MLDLVFWTMRASLSTVPFPRLRFWLSTSSFLARAFHEWYLSLPTPTTLGGDCNGVILRMPALQCCALHDLIHRSSLADPYIKSTPSPQAPPRNWGGKEGTACLFLGPCGTYLTPTPHATYKPICWHGIMQQCSCAPTFPCPPGSHGVLPPPTFDTGDLHQSETHFFGWMKYLPLDSFLDKQFESVQQEIHNITSISIPECLFFFITVQ